MGQHQIVNNVDHKDIKINTVRSKEFGDNIWYSLTFVEEFRAIQAYYPIFFQKDADTGQFVPVSLFGFQHEENLFLNDKGWDAGYIPLSVARQPFTIGTQKKVIDGREQEDRILALDMDNKRVNKDVGESLFLEFGGNSDYLDTIADMMETLHNGVNQNTNFIKCLTELDLLEPFTLDVQLNDGSQYQMIGFYTINEEKLEQLPAEKLADLVSSGYLKAIHMTMASQGNVAHLIRRKNEQLGLA
jgi:hypothetical protein